MLSASQIHRLQHQHETIDDLIASIDKSKITREIISGKWSIHDNIVHLSKYQPVL